MRWFVVGASAGFLACVGAGCDPQVDALYRGEPLARVTGSLIDRGGLGSLRPGPQTIDIGLIWVTRGGAELVALDGSIDEATGTYDAFVFDPPSHDAMLECDAREAPNGLTEPESRVGFAWIVAARTGALRGGPRTLADAVAMRAAGEILGWSEDRLLSYVEGDVREGSRAEALLGSVLGPGIHAMEGERELRAVASRDEVPIIVGGAPAKWTPFVPPDTCDASTSPIRVDEIVGTNVTGQNTGAETMGSQVATSPGTVASPSADPLGRKNEPGGLR